MRPDAEPRPQLAPLTRRLPAVGERELDPGALELDTGLAIRGEVPAWRGYGGRLTSSAASDSMGALAFGPLRWCAGAFVRASLDTRVDRAGRFELTGLAPTEDDLLASARGSGVNTPSQSVSLDDGAAPVLRVLAPAEGVVLDDGNLHCELEVLGDGRPLMGACVSLDNSRAGQSTSLPRTHRVALAFPTGEPVELVVQHPERDPSALRLTSESLPPDGVVRVDLEPAAPLPASENKHVALLHDFEVALEPGEDPRLEWRVELGVLLRVSIVGARAEPLTHTRLVDAGGAIDWLSWNRADSQPGSFTSGRSPFAIGRSIAGGALAPGAYRLELLRGSEVVRTHPLELTLDGSAEVVVDLSDLRGRAGRVGRLAPS